MGGEEKGEKSGTMTVRMRSSAWKGLVVRRGRLGGRGACSACCSDAIIERRRSFTEPATLDLVDADDGGALAVFRQDGAHLVQDEGVGTAAEGVELHQLDVLLLAHPAGGVEVAVEVLPLRHHMAVVEGDVLHGDAVFGDHIHAEIGEQLGDVVVDERVDVVGAPHQQDERAPGLLRIAQHLLAELEHLLLELRLGQAGRRRAPS